MKWFGPLLITAAVVLVYWQTLPYPFQFDDVGSILTNPTLPDFWSFHWFVPPATSGETVSGRPVLNLSFALNYALGALAVDGYRVTNVLIHLLAALALFGVAARAQDLFSSSVSGARDARCPTGRRLFPTALALLWALHPLQTGAVTYVVQRAESLAGLFYLFTLYCFLRGVGGELPAPSRPAPAGNVYWFWLAVLACFAGVATKETVVTAPVLVLLLDRALVSGSFAAAWKARWPFYAALAASWVVLGLLVAGNPARGGSAGFDSAVDVPTYLLTQCRALPCYLSLVVWPSGQVFDHGVATVRTLHEVVPGVLFLAALGATALVLLVRNYVAGVLLGGFFLLLAPSSSFVPVATQTIAEHRMYLPLAAILGLGGVVAAATVRAACVVRIPRWAPILMIGAAATALGLATVARNRTYRSTLILWQDTVAKCPGNPRAHHNLGLELVRAGRPGEAAVEFRHAIALQPNHAFAHAWLSVVLLERNLAVEAERHLRAALAADAVYGFAWLQLGHALMQQQRIDEAADAYATAVRLEPSDPDAHFGLANALAQLRRIDAATVEFRNVLRLDPARVEARANLGNCLLVTGRVREAMAMYEEVLRLRPGEPTAQRNLELAREYLRGGEHPSP